MPAFRYEAVDGGGQTKKGVLTADSARAARGDLRAQGLLPITVELITTQLDSAGKRKRSMFAEHLSTVELALFTRQLSSLLEAGLPLEQALSALLDQAERPYIRDLIASIRSEVNAGSSLSDALKQHPNDFVDFYLGLVASGSLLAGLRILSSQVGGELPGFLSDPVAQGLVAFALGEDHAVVAR